MNRQVLLVLILSTAILAGCGPTRGNLETFGQKNKPVQSSEYVCLNDIAAKYGMAEAYDLASRRYTVKSNVLFYSVVPGISSIIVNGNIVPLKAPVILENNRILVPYGFPELAGLKPVPRTAGKPKISRGSNERVADQPNDVVAPKNERVADTAKVSGNNIIKTIVIDPGHGGRDIGAGDKIPGLDEKDINLDIALKVAAILRKNGFEVHMTRDTDTTVELENRSPISNKYMPDMFVSIHTNAVAKNKELTEGFEIYCLIADKQKAAAGKKTTPITKGELFPDGKGPIARDFERFLYDVLLESNRKESFLLAESVLAELKNSKVGKSRGIKTQNFCVLRETIAPAILIELGYITHPGDRTNLNNDEFRARMAKAIADGIIGYKKKYEESYE